MACKAGWMSSGAAVCEKGMFRMPVCERQNCLTSEVDVIDGAATCGVNGVPLGELCTASCRAGYHLYLRKDGLVSEVNSINLTCLASSAEPESKPLLQYPASHGTASCRPSSCTANFSGSIEGAQISFPANMTLGSIASV